MSQETGRYVLEELRKALPPHKFAPAAINRIWPEVIREPKGAIVAAGDYLLLHSAYLPTPAAFLARVQLEGRLIRAKESDDRERDWNRKKGGNSPDQIRAAGSIFSEEKRDAHARHSVEAIRLMIDPRVTKERILEAFRVMEANYPQVGQSNPGEGWGVLGAKQQREWKQRCEACVIGRDDVKVPGRDMSQAHKWYGCYMLPGCRHVNGDSCAVA